MPPKRGIARPVKKAPQRSSFITDSDSDSPPAKKPNTTTNKTSASKSSTPEEQTFILSEGKNQKRVNISEFKGVKYVNIREYYEKDDEWLPGMKGISLNIEQFGKLIDVIPELKKQIGLDDAGEVERWKAKSKEVVEDSDEEAETKAERNEKMTTEDEDEDPIVGEKVDKKRTEGDEDSETPINWPNTAQEVAGAAWLRPQEKKWGRMGQEKKKFKKSGKWERQLEAAPGHISRPYEKLLLALQRFFIAQSVEESWQMVGRT